MTYISADGAPSVLVVDDEIDWLTETVALLSRRGIIAVAAWDPESAENMLRRYTDIAVVVVDLNLRTDNGVQMIKRFSNEGLLSESTQLLFITGQASEGDVLAALRCGALDFLEKPIDPDCLIVMVEYAIQRRQSSLKAQLSSRLSDVQHSFLGSIEFSLLELLQKLEMLRGEVVPQISDTLSWQLFIEAYGASLKSRSLSLKPTSLALGKPYSSCVRALTRLKAADMIVVLYDAHDRRRSFFSISERGARHMELLLERVLETLNSSQSR